jgi:hypothetical protein
MRKRHSSLCSFPVTVSCKEEIGALRCVRHVHIPSARNRRQTKKASERGEKFLLLLEQGNCPTPRTIAGKATGGSGMKRGKGRQGHRSGRASPMLLGVLQHGGLPLRKNEPMHESAAPAKPGAHEIRTSRTGNLALRIREIIAQLRVPRRPPLLYAFRLHDLVREQAQQQ